MTRSSKHKRLHKRLKPHEEFEVDNGTILLNKNDYSIELLIKTPRNDPHRRVIGGDASRVFVLMKFDTLDCGCLVNVYRSEKEAEVEAERQEVYSDVAYTCIYEMPVLTSVKEVGDGKEKSEANC